MASTVNVERSKLQALYTPLRSKIMDSYRAADALTGRYLYITARSLASGCGGVPPRKLGQWTSAHSAVVRGLFPDLGSVVDAIEVLAKRRDPSYIKRNHVRQRPGPKPAAYRTGAMNSDRPYHVGGEYRGGYK